MAIKIPKKRSSGERDDDDEPVDITREEVETGETDYKRQKVEEDIETPEM